MEMYMLDSALLILVYIAYLAFSYCRSLTYLHIYQQEEYDSRRFLNWLWASLAFDKRLSLALLMAGMIGIVVGFTAGAVAAIAAFFVITVLEKDPRQQSKKKLAMTGRVKRILYVALGLMALTSLWWFTTPNTLFWIISVQAIPLLIIAANVILQPYENHVQNKFWLEAHQKLLNLSPTVIGITGSFGKTSVKHILGHILKTNAPTLITPGSVNTPMGITRIIREQLDETHKYFVAEMGAYGPGSIARLCRLAPPDAAIITAIGHAHYERFKTLEAVAETKFELAQAALTKGGQVVVHETCLRFPYTRAMAEANPEHFVHCGDNKARDLKIVSVNPTAKGNDVHINWKGTDYKFDLPLHGLHHGHNAALAFALAVTLGIPPDHVITALKSVPQIPHRLEVKPQHDGTTIIDDAYNSNPAGFASALDTLALMTGRKILVTPGMVEMGAAHDEEHTKIGRKAGEICDVALVVVPERIPSFIAGFKKTGNGKLIVEVPDFKSAAAWLDQNRQSGDIILLENDLPDLYEHKLRL
jgi:UDP-N-acetylmuramoyl-tripeptide--D-alanyl-D-alanine ligase